MTSIALIQAAGGSSIRDPALINCRFSEYYKTLYSSRATYTLQELSQCLDLVDLLSLSPVQRENLEAPISLNEVRQAIGVLQSGKIPGPEGYPVEFYKTYTDQLAPCLQHLFTTLKDTEESYLHLCCRQ